MFTWLIEHTLLLLPTWFWFVVSGVGAVLYFFSGFIQAIPFAQARLAGVSVKYIGLGLLLGGIYLTGGAGVTDLWQKEIAEANARVEAAEAKSKETNIVIQKEYIDRVNTVKEVQVVVQDRIIKDAAKIDAECKIAPEAIADLNAAAMTIKGKK
jgi:hypothetical protein